MEFARKSTCQTAAVRNSSTDCIPPDSFYPSGFSVWPTGTTHPTATAAVAAAPAPAAAAAAAATTAECCSRVPPWSGNSFPY